MEELDFDKALEKLEAIVEQLESGRLSLESSLAVFEEGVGLALFCQRQLEATDGKVQHLMRRLNGELQLDDAEV